MKPPINLMGCGSVTHKVKVKARGYRKSGELKEVSVTLYGWKVWAIYEIKRGIPLVVKIDTIEKPDNLHVFAVLEQAKKNVNTASIIDSQVNDRGFLDGKVLHKIDQLGIEFVIPLKRNMEAAKDTRQLALDSESFPPVTREVEVVHGYGKKDTTKKHSPLWWGCLIFSPVTGLIQRAPRPILLRIITNLSL
jgi:hypothetical protein